MSPSFFSFRHRVVPPFRKGIAPQKPPDRQSRSRKNTPFSQRLQGILRTGGAIFAVGPDIGRNGFAIEFHGEQSKLYENTVKVFHPFAPSSYISSFLKAFCSSFLISAVFLPSIPSLATITMSFPFFRGVSLSICLYPSRMILLARFRFTALPTLLDTEIPSLFTFSFKGWAFFSLAACRSFKT